MAFSNKLIYRSQLKDTGAHEFLEVFGLYLMTKLSRQSFHRKTNNIVVLRSGKPNIILY